jgi:alpha-L-fucosidase 2
MIGTTPAKELILSGTGSDHEGVKGLVKFKVISKIKTEGGSVTANDTSLWL